MPIATVKFGLEAVEIPLPSETDVLAMKTPEAVPDPQSAIKRALSCPIGTKCVAEIAAERKKSNPSARAVIVVSDNTRPVPYRGPEGILWPIVAQLLAGGIAADNITVLIATGTHRPMTSSEIAEMIDPQVMAAGVKIVNHDCRDTDNLVFLGKTARGTDVFINKTYVQADVKVLTGLVESHFMAGVSGGRKSICPGLIGEMGTFLFHGAEMLASPGVRDLKLEDNPCHEEALQVAKKAGADFIVNVTLDHQLKITGVFAGELEKAHEQAVRRLREYVSIPVEKPYDIVITHGGFVGINHYQVAKAATAARPIIKKGGHLVIAANNTDQDPVGSHTYRTLIHLLKLIGPLKFRQLLLSPDWQFIPEQWQVQMWAKVFEVVPMDNFTYFSPQFSARDYAIIPGLAGSTLLNDRETQDAVGTKTIGPLIPRAVERAVAKCRAQGITEPRIAFLPDGPYGIPELTPSPE